ELDVTALRSWLGARAETGAAASTLARSAAAARTFTSWLASTGQLPHDVGGRLRAPRRGRHLPTVLSAEQAASLLTTGGPEGPTGSNSSTDHPVDQEPGSDPLQRRSEEHTSELQSRFDLVCRLLLANNMHDGDSRTNHPVGAE